MFLHAKEDYEGRRKRRGNDSVLHLSAAPICLGVYKVTCKHLNTRFKRFQPRFHSFAAADTEPAHSPRCKNQTFSVLFVGRTKRYKAIFPRGWSHDSDIYLADRLQKAGTYTKLHTRVTFVYSSSDAAMTVTRYVLPPIWAESPAGLRAARGSACVFM